MNVEKINNKRAMLLFYMFTCFLIILILRLFYIQFIKGDEYKKNALEQRTKNISVGMQRGSIYDRNLVPLTNCSISQHMIIYPEVFNSDRTKIHNIYILTGENIQNRLNIKRPLDLKISNYVIEIVEELKREKGIFILPYEERYNRNQVASHIIGYINEADNEGEYGLERRYNDTLTSTPQIYKKIFVDAQKRRILGLASENVVKKSKDGDLITTIDSKIQALVEDELDKQEKKASIVVLDAKSGDILCMASRPKFDSTSIVDSLKGQNKELYNRAIQIGYPPGSIFKVVVVAAALEEGIDIEQEFECKGYEKINDVTIKCHSYEKGGHGIVNMEDAFTQSCNSYFIRLAEKIGGDKIIDMAKKLGLGKKTPLNFIEENPGLLPSRSYTKGAGIGNLAIGQGQVEASVLQIAQMTNIICNKGIDRGIHILKNIEINNYSSKAVIDKSNAELIINMMVKVVEEGTGKKAFISQIQSAGKTGSAESYIHDVKNVHAWFTGFYPINNPKYVMTICVENGGLGGLVAAPMYKNIVQRLENIKNN